MTTVGATVDRHRFRAEPQTPRAAAAPRDYPQILDTALLRIAAVCVLAGLLANLDVTIISVAQRTLSQQFHAIQAVVAWTMTAYTLAYAAVIPLSGWATERFGAKRLFMAAVAVFTLSSLLCATAPNLTLLIGFRASQGLGAGVLLPLTFTILTREAGPHRMGRLMAVVGFPMLLGPIGGPILGGWVIDSFGWQWIFWINLPVGLLVLALAALNFPKEQPGQPGSFDVIGMLMLSPGLAALLYGLSSIPGRGAATDPHVYLAVSIGLLLIAGFVVHAMCRAQNPLIDLRLFKNRAVASANATMFGYTAAFLGASLLVPSCFQQLLGQTPLQCGLHLVPQGLGAMATMPIAGRLIDKHGPRKVVLAGLVLIACGMGTFASAIGQPDHRAAIVLVGLAIMGMGMGATMMPLSAAAVQTLTRQQVARGSTLLSVNAQLGGSIGTALMSMILTSQLHRSQDTHAYTVVFLLAAGLVAATLIPAALLPKNRPVAPPGPTPSGSSLGSSETTGEARPQRRGSSEWGRATTSP